MLEKGLKSGYEREVGGKMRRYSHSIVPGGFDVMSLRLPAFGGRSGQAPTTRFTAGTSFAMRLAMRASPSRRPSAPLCASSG
jgi:hypothetical protein